MSEKKLCCYDMWMPGQLRGTENPEDCEGVLTTHSEEGYPEDGYYIQVCPRLSTLGQPNGGVNFCGNGPDVITMHRDTTPTNEEYKQAARDADQMDW
jgi:hypothetical protein